MATHPIEVSGDSWIKTHASPFEAKTTLLAADAFHHMKVPYVRIKKQTDTQTHFAHTPLPTVADLNSEDYHRVKSHPENAKTMLAEYLAAVPDRHTEQYLVRPDGQMISIDHDGALDATDDGSMHGALPHSFALAFHNHPVDPHIVNRFEKWLESRAHHIEPDVYLGLRDRVRKARAARNMGDLM